MAKLSEHLSQQSTARSFATSFATPSQSFCFHEWQLYKLARASGIHIPLVMRWYDKGLQYCPECHETRTVTIEHQRWHWNPKMRKDDGRDFSYPSDSDTFLGSFRWLWVLGGCYVLYAFAILIVQIFKH